MALAVHECSPAISALAIEWCVAEALMGGTPAMRRAGKAHLPQWPAEELAAYNARLSTATLFPAYRRTVGVMAGKPFSKELTLSADTPASIQTWAEDIDQQGVSLHAWAADAFHETVAYGLDGVLIDYPAVPTGKGRTVAQVEASGARPYFVHIKHHQILGWRAAVQGGKMRLTQLRIVEAVEEEDGAFGVTCVPQVRVLFPGGWQTWREIAGKGWQMYTSGRTTLSDIPFVPFYGRRAGFMIGEPALLDLAYLNVKHWQSQSDQDTILHAARVPILTIAGIDEMPQLAIGGSTAINLGRNPDAKILWVEHTGAAIEAGAKSLAALEEQMIQTGAELLVKKPGQRTAAESNNDAEGNKCDLQRMAEGFEDALDQALWFMAQYARLPSAGKVSLFKDYGAATLSDASATLVKDLNMAGIVTKSTVIEEMKRRGVLSSDIDTETEIAAAEAEGPPLGGLGVPPEVGSATSVAG